MQYDSDMVAERALEHEADRIAELDRQNSEAGVLAKQAAGRELQAQEMTAAGARTKRGTQKVSCRMEGRCEILEDRQEKRLAEKQIQEQIVAVMKVIQKDQASGNFEEKTAGVPVQVCIGADGEFATINLGRQAMYLVDTSGTADIVGEHLSKRMEPGSTSARKPGDLRENTTEKTSNQHRLAMEEGKVVNASLMMRGGGKRKTRVKNPWNSSESETEKKLVGRCWTMC